jgi:hypothetical protein
MSPVGRNHSGFVHGYDFLTSILRLRTKENLSTRKISTHKIKCQHILLRKQAQLQFAGLSDFSKQNC